MSNTTPLPSATAALLFDESPLVIQRAVVRLLGSHELAVLLQQIHYRARHGVEDEDGHRWAIAPSAEWRDDVVMGEKQFKRCMARLVDLGVVIREQAAGYDRTAWTRVDYERLEELRIDRDRTDALVPNRTDGTVPNRTDGTVPNRTDVRTTEITKSQEELFPDEAGKTPAAAVALTDSQVANRIARDYWAYVEERTGRAPVGLPFVALARMLTPFVAAGWTVAQIKTALLAMYDRGRTLSRQAIEVELSGRGGRARPGGRPTVEARAEVVFDADGNVVLS